MPKNSYPRIVILLIAHDILHQSTCPHTPQQNGLAKVKSDIDENCKHPNG